MLIRIASSLAVVLVVSSAACARQIEPGTTTVTSGTTSSTRVAGMRSDLSPVAMRLADELCARELACNHIGPGAQYRTDEACLADRGAGVPREIATWSCSPADTDPGFETCLAAIRSERCETPLPRADRLVACRSQAICAQ